MTNTELLAEIRKEYNKLSQKERLLVPIYIHLESLETILAYLQAANGEFKHE